MSGFGIFTVLAGVGIGCAAYGYSYVTDQRAAAGNLADALASALRETVLKTEGTVQLADGSTVKLDPNAKVRVEGTVRQCRAGRPTDEQMAPDAMPASAVKPVTNFTIFKTIKFRRARSTPAGIITAVPM